MRRILKTLTMLCLLMLTLACMEKGTSEEEMKQTVTRRNSNFTPYLRGTVNNWEKDKMYKVSNDTWAIIVNFDGNDEFKVDVLGDWSQAYPTKNYQVNDGYPSNYKVSFNEITKEIELTKVYSVLSLSESKTYIEQGDTDFTLPQNVLVRQSGHMNSVNIESWYPELNVEKLGTTTYIAKYGNSFTTYELTVNPKTSASLELDIDKAVIKKADNTFTLPQYAKLDKNGELSEVELTWETKLDVNTVGTRIYTGRYEGGSETVKFELEVTEGYLNNGEQVYYRGTTNGWGQSEMTLVDDYTWETTQEFDPKSSEGAMFKVTIGDNWDNAYPENRNYPIYEKGKYRIRFNAKNKYFDVDKMEKRLNVYPSEDKIYQGDEFELPKTGNYYNNGDYANVELNWTPELDLEKIGTTNYTATYDGLSVEFALTIVSNGNVGNVKLMVFKEYVVDGAIKKNPFSHAGVYLDGNSPYGGPGAQYRTDQNGIAEFKIDAGSHTVKASKMESSHSITVSQELEFEIAQGENREIELILAPNSASVYVLGNCRPGKAFYVTGDTKYLGNWETAYKMEYNEQENKWISKEQYPIGANFKIVRADYADADYISTANVEWEIGGNRRIYHPYAYGNSINEASPVFHE